MKTVLVTGSEGNIGQYIVAALLRKYPTWKLIRVKNGTGDPFFDAEQGRYVGDLRDPSIFKLILRDNSPDYVIHAASTSYSHDGYRSNPFAVLHNDCLLTLNTLKHTVGVEKFVFLSSALVYEHARESLLKEDLTNRLPAPTSSYGVAKYLGEQAVLNARREFGTTYTIWRPFNVVSPLEPTAGDGRHVFVDFFRRIFVERVNEIGVLGGGEQVRCFIWVEEVAECIVAALDNSATDDQIINLARDEPTSVSRLKEMLVTIGKDVNVLPRTYDPPIRAAGAFAGVEMATRIPCIQKLKELTHWQSSISVESCLRRFVQVKLNCDQFSAPLPPVRTA